MGMVKRGILRVDQHSMHHEDKFRELQLPNDGKLYLVKDLLFSLLFSFGTVCCDWTGNRHHLAA